jgi:tyramine receptor
MDCEHDPDASEQDQNKVTTINMSSMNPLNGRNSLDGYYESDNQDGHYEAPSKQCQPTSSSGNGNNHHFHKSVSNQRLVTHIVNKKSSKQSDLTSTKSIQQKSLSSRILTLKRENKTTQTLSIVCGSFIAFWLPFFIYYLITPFLPDDKKSPVLAEVLTWLGWINSAINPFIYAFYSVDFRAAFWRLTLKRFFRNSQKNQFASHTMSIRR